jgi:hypothetical protein
MSEMIIDSSKKRHISQGKLSWEEKVELCNRWKESGLNKSQFCKKHGLALPTFCEWCNRVWPRTKKQTSTLTPVRIVNKQEKKEEQQIVVELSLPNQAKVKMSLPLSSIGRLIQELCHGS